MRNIFKCKKKRNKPHTLNEYNRALGELTGAYSSLNKFLDVVISMKMKEMQEESNKQVIDLTRK